MFNTIESKEGPVTAIPKRSPQGLPLLGNAIGLVRNPHEVLVKAMQVNSLSWVYALGTKMLVVSEPQIIKALLEDHAKELSKRGWQEMVTGELFGTGLVALPTNETWKLRRRNMAPALAHREMSKYALTMQTEATRMVKICLSERTNTINVATLFGELTMRVVSSALFSRAGIDKLEVFETATQAMWDNFNGRFIFLPAWVPTPANRRYHRALDSLHKVVVSLIEERLEEQDGADHNDLLSMLIDYYDTSSSSGLADLMYEMITLFVAGHETTASLLTMTCYLLTQRPEVVASLRGELDEQLAGKPVDPSRLSDEGYLPILRSVIKAVLLLYPPAWMLSRMAEADINVQVEENDGVVTYRIPKGTSIIIATYAVQRDPQYFPDPNEFKPERWQDTEWLATLPKCAYLPFGAGSRICIGNHFALLEAMTVLAELVQKVDMQLVKGYKLELKAGLSLMPKAGLPLHFTARRKDHES